MDNRHDVYMLFYYSEGNAELNKCELSKIVDSNTIETNVLYDKDQIEVCLG